MSLNSVIGYAYRAHDMLSHVQGGPDWLSSTQYDIEAKVDDSQMTDWDKLTDAERDDRVRPMLRQLLAERFQLKLHEETRETPVYLLVLAKGGPKFKQTSAPEPLPGDGDPIQQTLRFMRDHPGQSIPGNLMCTGNGCSGHNVDFQYAWGQIGASARAEYPVLDRTGLKGYYDISYTISRGPDAATPMQQIEDQLGLRFESSKAPTVSFIIDSAKKPTEN